MTWERIVVLFCAALLVAGCKDKAHPDLQTCEQLKAAGKLAEAAAACDRAVAADPKTADGRKAADEAKELRIALQKEDDAAKAKAEAEERQNEERSRLLASAAPADWAKLVKDFPDSREARLAEEKIRKHDSLCADRSSWSFTLALKRLGERGGQAAMMSKMSDSFAASSAVGLGKNCEEEAKRLEGQAKEVQDHAVLAGEESIQKELAADLKKLADQNRKWSSAFNTYSGDLAPYVALQADTERVADAVLKHDSAEFTKCLSVPGGKGATPSGSSSAQRK